MKTRLNYTNLNKTKERISHLTVLIVKRKEEKKIKQQLGVFFFVCVTSLCQDGFAKNHIPFDMIILKVIN